MAFGVGTVVAADGTCDTRAQYGETALMCAARGGRAHCARLLLDAGADKDAKDANDAKVRASVRRVCGRARVWLPF